MKYYHVESVLGQLGAAFPDKSIEIRDHLEYMLEHIVLLDSNGDYAVVFDKVGKKCFPVYDFVKSPPFESSCMTVWELECTVIDTIFPVFENLYTDDIGLSIAIHNYTGEDSTVKSFIQEFSAYLVDICPDGTIVEGSPTSPEAPPVAIEPPRKYFNSDKWATRRPPGDFFMVDMIAPSAEGAAPKRVNILGSNGQEISSLQLNISPNTLNISASKKVNRVQTFTRWLEEHWGDELDQISFGGSTFAFIDFKGAGLCVESRELTDPYQELQYLTNIYKSNGCTYQGEQLGSVLSPREFFNYGNPAIPYYVRRHPRVGFIKSRVHIKLRCDFLEAIGYFESFDVVEDAGSPFKLNFSVSFRSEHTRWL